MSTDTIDTNCRFPTTGPEATPYDGLRFTTTAGDNGLLYHVDHDDQWIEADRTVALGDWR